MVKTANGALYTGITTNIQRRFIEHCAQSHKTAKALRGKAPLTLAFCSRLNSHSDALKAECWVKKQLKSTKLKLIDNAAALPFEHEVQVVNELISMPMAVVENKRTA
jgi:putative endonuclease